MTAELDLGLDDFQPADTDSAQAEDGMWAGDLRVLAEHHTTPGESRSYVIAHDESATWGVPGSPQLVALTVTRDFDRRTFTLETATHASLPFAQAWLIERGCPPDKTALVGDFMQAADDHTLRVEEKIRAAGQRYEVLETQTFDYDPCETWTMARDTLAAQDPIRVFLEEGNPKAFTYTLREGAFADEDAARGWLDDRSSPLPEPPESRGDAASLRVRSALTRSAGTTATACGLDTLPARSTATVQRPGSGRSL